MTTWSPKSWKTPTTGGEKKEAIKLFMEVTRLICEVVSSLIFFSLVGVGLLVYSQKAGVYYFAVFLTAIGVGGYLYVKKLYIAWLDDPEEVKERKQKKVRLDFTGGEYLENDLMDDPDYRD